MFSCDMCAYKTINRESYFEHVSDHRKEQQAVAAVDKKKESSKDGMERTSRSNVDLADESSNASSVVSSTTPADEVEISGSNMPVSLDVGRDDSMDVTELRSVTGSKKEMAGKKNKKKMTTVEKDLKVEEDDDSFHDGTNPEDLGGTTIPAEPLTSIEEK